MPFDNAYDALTEGDDDARWAYGTGFTDPLDGVDTALPDGVAAGELADYCLMLGDDALVLSHRLQQWVARAPELEDDVALANIGLDLLGQARMLLTRGARAQEATGDAGPVPPGPQPAEDRLAFFRAEQEFRNVRLVEPACEDFAQAIVRLLVFATWRLALFDRLRASSDPVVAAIAAKGATELTYHRDYAAQWTVRLGDGTAESHRRTAAALDAVWPLYDELFDTHPVERSLVGQGAAVDPAALRTECGEVLAQVLRAATLPWPQTPTVAGVGGGKGRDGIHTEAMGYLLAEMQSVARQHPRARW